MEPLTIGQHDPVLAVVKARLGVVPADEEFTEALAQRVRGLQLVHGMKPDGLVDEAILDVLEIPGG